MAAWVLGFALAPAPPSMLSQVVSGAKRLQVQLTRFLKSEALDIQAKV
jgi:hypothetical protein